MLSSGHTCQTVILTHVPDCIIAGEFFDCLCDVCLSQSDEKCAAQASTSSTVASSSKVTTATTGKPATVQKGSKDVVLSRLLKLEPKELMNEIVSGHVPLSLLNQVAGRLPAEMLQEAVDFLSKTDSGSATDSESSSITQLCEHSRLCCL